MLSSESSESPTQVLRLTPKEFRPEVLVPASHCLDCLDSKGSADISDISIETGPGLWQQVAPSGSLRAAGIVNVQHHGSFSAIRSLVLPG